MVAIDHAESTFADRAAFSSTLLNRPLDQLFVLNEIGKLGAANSGSFLSGVVDANNAALVGYSMGSFLGVGVAADVPAVRALVLAAGGDLPTGTPFERFVRAAADPLKAVRRLGGRPLLMVHGRRDGTVRCRGARRGHLAGRRLQVPDGHGAQCQSDPHRLLGSHAPAADDELEGPGVADRLDQRQRPPEIGHQPQAATTARASPSAASRDSGGH